jgi:hypothetical protein
MSGAKPPKSRPNLQQRIDHILNSGQMKRQEHLLLISAMLSDEKVSDEDRRQINRIFDYIHAGKIKLVD